MRAPRWVMKLKAGEPIRGDANAGSPLHFTAFNDDGSQITCGCGKSVVGAVVPHGDGAQDSHSLHICVTRQKAPTSFDFANTVRLPFVLPSPRRWTLLHIAVLTAWYVSLFAGVVIVAEWLATGTPF